MRESIRWRMNGGVVKLKNNSFEWIMVDLMVIIIV